VTSRFPRGLERLGALAAAAGALLVWAITRTYPNYDSYFHLVWGRQLLHGTAPTFEAYAAPTQHPLYVLLCGLLGAVFGEGGDRALVLVCLLSQAALIYGAYRLGAAVFGRWSGLLGALFVAASASFWLYAARGYVDSPFLALVVWAAVFEVEGRGPWRPLGLLMAAGLLRPEAWVLGGLAWLWWLPRERRRAALTAGVVFAPLVWALVDLLSTGDPLHSLHATSDLADDLGRVRGLRHVPGSFTSFVSATVRPPVALLAVAGLVLARLTPGWRAVRVPLALFAAGVITFVGTGALGLSILPRYLTVPSVALCLFGGYALAGFTALAPGHPWRRRWAQASGAATVLGIAGLAILAPSLANVRAEVRFIRATHDSLIATLDDPAVRAGLRCGPLTFPTYRLVPDSRWHLDARIGARSDRRSPYGIEVFAVGQKALQRYGFAAGTSTLVNLPDPGYAPLVRHGLLSAYRRCRA
jgi:Dolichyl-phosphate-mannose-protein mannosyltransferase